MVIKSKITWLAGDVSWIWDKINAHKFCLKAWRKRPFRALITVSRGVGLLATYISPAHVQTGSRPFYGHGNQLSGLIKAGNLSTSLATVSSSIILCLMSLCTVHVKGAFRRSSSSRTSLWRPSHCGWLLCRATFRDVGTGREEVQSRDLHVCRDSARRSSALTAVDNCGS